MKSFFYHLQFNIDFSNLKFYKDFFDLLGWQIIFETKDTIGFKSKTNGDIWFVESEFKDIQNYDEIGFNHIAIRTDQQNDVDIIKDAMERQSIKMLFGTPRHRPEYTSSDSETYYQILFETPDKLLIEVVYIGAKS